MKVLLYTELEKKIGKSGLGKAINHQKKALESQGIEWTQDKDGEHPVAGLSAFCYPAGLCGCAAVGHGTVLPLLLALFRFAAKIPGAHFTAPYR